MKTTALLAAFLLVTGTALAQEAAKEITSGTVKYTETVKVEVHLEGEAAQFSNLLPTERKSQKLLYFSQEAALYLNDKKNEEENLDLEGGGGMVQVRMMEPDNRLFTDLKNKKQVEQREFMTRMFLIEGDMEKTPWKLTGNGKEILGYTCQEAVMEKDSTKIVAWFTPSVPVAAGPGQYNNLPGLVLEVNVDDGRRVIVATSLDSQPVGSDMLAKPKEGKKVTADEFRKIVDEKMKEMNIENGGREGSGGVMMIRIQK